MSIEPELISSFVEPAFVHLSACVLFTVVAELRLEEQYPK